MKNNFFCNKSYINIFETPSNNSKISSQVLYGEEFKILKREKYFLKIRTIYDNYIGYIKKRKFKKKINISHKVKVLKTKINKSDNYLPFLSKIEILAIWFRAKCKILFILSLFVFFTFHGSSSLIYLFVKKLISITDFIYAFKF